MMTTIDGLEGVELDAVVHAVRGMEPGWRAIVTNDGGACIASTCASGPWYTSNDLRGWLRSQQDRGRYADYGIIEIPVYPPYHRDIAQAWELLTGVYYCIDNHEDCVACSIHTGDVEATTDAHIVVLARGDTAAAAICRAYLKARGWTSEEVGK